MKTCKSCFRQYESEDLVGNDPAYELATLFLSADTDLERDNDLCPTCREEIGILNLLGFGQ